MAAYIRCVTTCNGGKIVLADKPNPSINPELDPEQAAQTYLWSRFPFSKTQSHTDTGNPWGMGDFEQLEMLNIEINKTISQLTLVKDRVARVKLINPQDTGVSNNEFTNAPGIINPSNAMVSQAIRYLDPPSINPELFKVLDIYQSLFFQVAGSFELEQADAIGKNVIAYKAIAALLERAATMLRGKIRNYSKMIRARGRMYLSHAMNWWNHSESKIPGKKEIDERFCVMESCGNQGGAPDKQHHYYTDATSLTGAKITYQTIQFHPYLPHTLCTKTHYLNSVGSSSLYQWPIERS